MRDIFLAAATSELLAPAIVKASAALPGESAMELQGLIHEAGLTPEEAQRVFVYSLALGRHYQSQFRASSLPEVERTSLNRIMRGYYNSPLGRFMFEQGRRSGRMSNDFIAHIDELLARDS